MTPVTWVCGVTGNMRDGGLWLYRQDTGKKPLIASVKGVTIRRMNIQETMQGNGFVFRYAICAESGREPFKCGSAGETSTFTGNTLEAYD